VLVGLLESFSSFWASAFKEVIVFTLIIPVLLWRSLTTNHVEEEELKARLPSLPALRWPPSAVAGPAPCSPEFYVTLLNYIGLYALVALGLVLLTGVGGLTSFGQAAFVGLGAYATAYLTTAHGMSPWGRCWSAWRSPLRWRCARLHHAAPVGPLPAAGHHRLGHQPVLPVRQPGASGRPHRHDRHSGRSNCSASS
jgi:ABC-type branched-subunit amino acid transport system permease subunit